MKTLMAFILMAWAPLLAMAQDTALFNSCLSLGGGNFQGIGIFDDWNGDDTYNTSGRFILGGANGLQQGARTYLYTFGVFVDGGGQDNYREPWAKNGARWISPKADSTQPGPYEIGVGIDK